MTEACMNHPDRPADGGGPDQAWFWTEQWQAGEREADVQVARGEGTMYHSAAAFLASLRPSTDHEPAVRHIASWPAELWALIRMRAPKALCGVSLEAGPGDPAVPADAPECPDCARRARR